MNIYRLNPLTGRWMLISSDKSPHDARTLACSMSARNTTLYTIASERPETKQPNIYFFNGTELEPKASSYVQNQVQGHA